jgi:hypothetical protein
MQKVRLEDKMIKLKEVLCELNPEALEEIERDCEQKVNLGSDSNQEGLGGREKHRVEQTKAIKKKNDKKKKRK